MGCTGAPSSCGCVWIMSWCSLTPPKHPVSLSGTLLGVNLTCATYGPHSGSRMEDPAFLLTAGEPGNCILPPALSAAEAAGGSAASAGLGVIAIQVWHRQVRLQHLVSCLRESRVGVWELAGTLGSHRVTAPVPGAFLCAGSPGESS